MVVMKRLLLLTAILLAATAAMAYDFSAPALSGQTLYFNIVEGGVEVTCPGSANANAWNGFTKPTGALSLPASVVNSGTTYNVVGVGRYAFYNCYGLTSVVVPEGVATIGQASFSGCSAIDSVFLPSTLAALSNTSFYGCTSLSKIVCMAAVPPSVTATTFGNVPASACMLYVPCASVAAYAAATGWSDFDVYSYGSCNATLAATVNHADRGTVSGAGSYAVGTVVTLSATAADGFFFAFWDDGDTTNPRLVTLASDTSFTAMFYPSLRDTVVVTEVQHDTVVLHDTVTVPVVYVDTVYMFDTVWLTDTISITDTVNPTYFRLQVQSSAGGIGIGSTLVPAGTELEIGALPLEGYRFAGWDDGSAENPRRLTLTANTTLTPSFAPLSGIDATAVQPWNAVVEGRFVVLDGVQGQEVGLYDIRGRLLFRGRADADRMVLRTPAAGLYLVSVDGGAARKLTVVEN